MTKEEFNQQLKKAGLSKKNFAAILETSQQSINNWGSNDRDIPYWVASWLENYIARKRFETIKTIIKESDE